MLHAATRRDCDGDEASVTLLLDALLNFSRSYLPSTRGATQDAPLVLTYQLIPSQVDDMIFDMDVVWKYPLEFYEACNSYKKPKEVKIEQERQEQLGIELKEKQAKEQTDNRLKNLENELSKTKQELEATKNQEPKIIEKPVYIQPK